MSRLTKRGIKQEGMIWFVDHENNDMPLEPCEMSPRNNRVMLEKLADFEDKQEQGLLIELPVPIGTEVYKVVEDKTAVTIETIKHNGHEYHRTIPCYFVCRDLFTFSMLNEVGKTVFLTLDEARQAEEALAKMGGKQDEDTGN